MYKGKKIIAIIPARGGSKGIPGKNIKILAGVPLICHTIESVKKSSFVDIIIVSTDDKKIASIAKEADALVPFMRPKQYAKDSSPSSDAILHAIDWFEKKKQWFDIVILLEPTSPLRKEDDIDKAIQKFVDSYATVDALVSVGEIHMESPYISKVIDHGFVKPLIEEHSSYYQRQQLPKAYFPYGVIYISKIETYKIHKTFYQKRTIPYVIERWQNYEIDDIYDFACIEKILEEKDKIVKENVSQKKYPVRNLTGEQIFLKEFIDDHLFNKRYLDWLRDREVIQTIGRSEYFNEIPFSSVETYVRNLQQSENDYFFAIHMRKTDQFIGTAKIGSIDWNSKTADLGIMIGEKRYWGRGIATDVFTVLCTYVFSKLQFRKLTGGCLGSNIAMIKCFKKIGFKKEGTRKKQFFLGGKIEDHEIYGLLKEKYLFNKVK